MSALLRAEKFVVFVVLFVAGSATSLEAGVLSRVRPPSKDQLTAARQRLASLPDGLATNWPASSTSPSRAPARSSCAASRFWIAVVHRR